MLAILAIPKAAVRSPWLAGAPECDIFLAKMLKVYSYSNCSTCRDAAKWLRARGVEFEERPIRETPPSLKELETMLAAYKGALKRLFNTSGLDYRAGKVGEKLETISTRDALGLLESNGNLVKRPFVIGPGVALVGFDEGAWESALASRSHL
jgi:Spx/MgsR family transcriptional regulator